MQKSCFQHVKWRIPAVACVYDALSRMVSDNVNALAVTTVSSGGNGSSGCTISGLFTTRDFMHKMALKDRDARTVTVGEVCSWRLISVTKSTPIEKCMEIMLEHGVRHLFIKDDVNSEIIGLVSIKDIVKCLISKEKATLDHLETKLYLNELASSAY